MANLSGPRLFRPIKFQKRTHIYLLLFVCGDISLNPGSVKNPCGKCSRPLAKNHRAVQCEACYYWLLIKCEGIFRAEYTILCRLAIVQTVEIKKISKSTHHTKKKLSSLIALLLFQTVWTGPMRFRTYLHIGSVVNAVD